MQTLTSLLEEDTHTTEPLALALETRVFLSELLRQLGETLKPGKAPGVQARQQFLEAHLGAPYTDHTIVSRRYPRPASNQVLVALEDVLRAEPCRTGRPVDYDDDEGQRAPRYRCVPISPSQTRPVLEEGYYPVHRGRPRWWSGLPNAHLRELVVGAFTCALEEAGDAARAGTASVTTSHFLQALESLERRVDGPDRWRTVWRASGR